MTPVFVLSYIIAFVLSYYNIFLTIFCYIRTIFLTKNLEIINLKSSINERDIIKGQNFEIISKTLLMYIKKRIDKVKDLYKTPVFISLSLFLYLSIKIRIFESKRKNLIYTIKSWSISSLIICLRNYFLEIWSNTFLKFIIRALVSFFSFYNSYIIYTKINIISITDLFFEVYIYFKYSFEYIS